MLVIPALDLQPDSSRVYAAEVAEMILRWERAGFVQAQLTLAPSDRNLADSRLLEDALRDAHLAVQVAGRFEASEDIEIALSAGASFVVLGSRAIDELDWLASATGRFPGQLLVATPARERRSRSRGAVRTLPLDLREMASEIGAMPVAGLIIQFGADETIGIPELALLEDVAEEAGCPVQVSGGGVDLGTLRDLEFRGVAATIISAATLSAEFDEQVLARSFVD